MEPPNDRKALPISSYLERAKIASMSLIMAAAESTSTMSSSSSSSSSPSSSSSVKENTLTPSAAADFRRRVQSKNLSKATKAALGYGLRCAGLLAAPCLLLCALLTMGTYGSKSNNLRVHRSLFSTGGRNSLPEIVSSSSELQCRTNAIAYFMKKDSHYSLERSLDLLFENYLNEFYQDTHVFLFHTGDVTMDDLKLLEWRYAMKTRGTIQLVNIAGTQYWEKPDNVGGNNDNNIHPSQLLHGKLQRKNEHRFWGIKVWDYFDALNNLRGCNYRYVMRLHQDSLIYSPIKYNLFDFMQTNNYNYGFRMCAWEMESSELLWDDFTKTSPVMPEQDWSIDDCTVYSPFFVADLQFFLSRKVQRFLKYVEKGSYIYRHAIDTSVLHSMAVYAFAPTETIHRYLDFTFEHFYRSKKSNCPQYGAIQAGYNDVVAKEKLAEWQHVYVPKTCQQTHIKTLATNDLEPAYAHLPSDFNIELATLSVGNVELTLHEIMQASYE